MIFEIGSVDCLVVLVGEFQCWYFVCLWQDYDVGVEQYGGIGLVLGGEYFVYGEVEDQGDQGDEDEDGFVDLSYGWVRFQSGIREVVLVVDSGLLVVL